MPSECRLSDQDWRDLLAIDSIMLEREHGYICEGCLDELQSHQKCVICGEARSEQPKAGEGTKMTMDQFAAFLQTQGGKDIPWRRT